MKLIRVEETDENLEISFRFPNQSENSKAVLNLKTFRVIGNENIPELTIRDKVMLQGFLEKVVNFWREITIRK